MSGWDPGWRACAGAGAKVENFSRFSALFEHRPSFPLCFSKFPNFAGFQNPLISGSLFPKSGFLRISAGGCTLQNPVFHLQPDFQALSENNFQNFRNFREIRAEFGVFDPSKEVSWCFRQISGISARCASSETALPDGVHTPLWGRPKVSSLPRFHERIFRGRGPSRGARAPQHLSGFCEVSPLPRARARVGARVRGCACACARVRVCASACAHAREFQPVFPVCACPCAHPDPLDPARCASRSQAYARKILAAGGLRFGQTLSLTFVRRPYLGQPASFIQCFVI